MKIQIGELLISATGEYYRVIEATEIYVSLMRVSGYTLFSCKPFFVEDSFRPVPSSPISPPLIN